MNMPHRMVHDKILYDQCIIRDIGNPTALFISYNICLCIFSRTNILKCKIKSMHYTWSLKDVRILALHNNTRDLTCRSVIGYDLDDILSTNLSDTIFKLFHDVIHVFHFSLSTYGVQEHRALLCASAHLSLQMETPFASMYP